jgi:hypothetical protein
VSVTADGFERHISAERGYDNKFGIRSCRARNPDHESLVVLIRIQNECDPPRDAYLDSQLVRFCKPTPLIMNQRPPARYVDWVSDGGSSGNSTLGSPMIHSSGGGLHSERFETRLRDAFMTQERSATASWRRRTTDCVQPLTLRKLWFASSVMRPHGSSPTGVRCRIRPRIVH